MRNELVYEIICDILIIKKGKIIPSEKFWGNKIIKKVIFECNIEEIGYGAFCGCNIEEIEIPRSVKKIGENAFERNKNLRKIKLNKGLEYIGRGAFNRCNLVEIEIPESVKSIESFAFYQNKNLTRVKLNEGLKSVKFYSFGGCNMIKEIIIPFTVEDIDNNAFMSSSLKKVYLYEGSPISKYSKDRLDIMFGDKVEPVIISITKTLTNKEADNRLNKVCVEESKRLGYELLNLISNDNYKEDTDNLDKVKKLLLDGANTEVVDDYINTGLMICIKKNLINTFNMYLSVRCNINHKNKLGDTPLILCARDNRNDMADVLINSNCFIKDTNKLDETALSIAYKNNNWYLINKLESILGINKQKEDIMEKARRLVREYKKDE